MSIRYRNLSIRTDELLIRYQQRSIRRNVPKLSESPIDETYFFGINSMILLKMSKDHLIVIIDSDSELRIAADLMSSRKIRKLSVIDDDKVIGIITATDLVHPLAKP